MSSLSRFVDETKTGRDKKRLRTSAVEALSQKDVGPMLIILVQ